MSDHPHVLRLGILYYYEKEVEQIRSKELDKFVKGEDKKTDTYYKEHFHLVIDEDLNDNKYDLMDDRNKGIFTSLEQFFRSYPSYTLRLSVDDSLDDHDMLLFSRNKYSDTKEPGSTKGTFAINLLESIDKDAEVLISGLEQRLVSELSEQVLIKGRFGQKNVSFGEKNDKKMTYYYFSLSDQAMDDIADWVKGWPELNDLFLREKPLIKPLTKNLTSLWDLYVFDNDGVCYSISNFYTQGKKVKEPHFDDIMAYKISGGMRFIPIIISTLSSWSKGKYELREIILPDRILLFDKLKIADNYSLNFLLELSNEYAGKHYEAVKGFEREFLEELKDEIGILINEPENLRLFVRRDKVSPEEDMRSAKGLLDAMPEEGPINKSRVMDPSTINLDEHIKNLPKDNSGHTIFNQKMIDFNNKISDIADRLVSEYFTSCKE